GAVNGPSSRFYLGWVGLVVVSEARLLESEESRREALIADLWRQQLASVPIQDVELVAVQRPAHVVVQLLVGVGVRGPVGDSGLARAHVDKVERRGAGRPAGAPVPDVLVDSARIVVGPVVGTRRPYPQESDRSVGVRPRRRDDTEVAVRMVAGDWVDVL